MSKLFGIADLWPAMQAMYPEVEDEREDDDDYEHPMTAVGLILLSAACDRLLNLGNCFFLLVTAADSFPPLD